MVGYAARIAVRKLSPSPQPINKNQSPHYHTLHPVTLAALPPRMSADRFAPSRRSSLDARKTNVSAQDCFGSISPRVGSTVMPTCHQREQVGGGKNRGLGAVPFLDVNYYRRPKVNWC